MWEYDRFDFEVHTISELNKKLNELGANNWEIIHYSETKPEKFGSPIKVIILLKRKKEQL